MGQPVYFEEIPVGLVYRTVGRTVREADIVNFAGVSGDFNPLHMDDEFMKGSQYGRPIAHGLLGVIMYMHSELDDWALVAYAGMDRQFRAPIFAGDTLHFEYEVLEKRESRSKPDRGVITVAVRLINHRDEVVQDGRDVLVVYRRPA